MERDTFSPDELARRYLFTLLGAAVTGLAAGFGSAPFLTSDRNPALLVGAAAGLLVLTVAALVTARRVDRATLLTMARIGLWSAFVAAAAPGLAWFVLWLSDSNRQSVLGLAAVVVGGIPLFVDYEFPRARAVAVACCLLAPLAMLVFWQRLFLLLPFSLTAAVAWAVVLTLLGKAARRRAENVVPSN